MDKTLDLSDIMSDFSLKEVLAKIETKDLIEELSKRTINNKERDMLINYLYLL